MVTMFARTAFMLAAAATILPAAEWSRFRGPNGTGVADASGLPDQIAPDRNVAWRTALPHGYSSPVVSNSNVYLTGWDGLKLYTLCLERKTGKVSWRTEGPTPLAKEHKTVNTPVSPSPVTDGTNVYVFFEVFGLVSYDAKGQERWRHPLGPFRMPYGAGSSPVLAGNTLLLLVDQDVRSYLLALDKDTGKQLWQAERPHATHGFSTPVIYRPGRGPVEVIVSGAYELDAYDLQSGKKLWWVSGMAWQAKSLPVVAGDTMYVYSWMAGLEELGHKPVTLPWSESLAQYDKNKDGVIGKDEYPDESLVKLWFLYDLDANGTLDATDWRYLLARGTAKNGLYAIRLGGRGDVTSTHVVWRYEKGLPNIPSPLLYGDILYVLREGGILTAFDPKTGKVLKQGRIEGAVDSYFASPVAADGKIITASQEGKVAVIRPGAEWQVENVGEFGEEIWSTPAIDGGQVFLRTKNALYCFEKPKQAASLRLH
jgi:outer membrane protein assembly factor BamB